MTRDELYQSTDGVLSDMDRRMIRHGGYAEYCRAFARTAARLFTERLHDTRRILCIKRRKGDIITRSEWQACAALRNKAFEADMLVRDYTDKA